MVFLNRLKRVVKKKNMKKFGELLEPLILRTARLIIFNFCMKGNETVGHLRRDFEQNQPSSFVL